MTNIAQTSLLQQQNPRLRSYIRRERKLTPEQQTRFQSLWNNYGVSLKSNKIDFVNLFNKPAPCVLEIGFGMGESLLKMAQNYPEYNYIGVEVYQPGVISLCKGAAAAELDNVRVFHADAWMVLTHCIPDASLDRIQIFFPDPWPKRRQNKRRLIQAEFVDLLANKLKTGGLLHLATDWEDYATHMMRVVSASEKLHNPHGAGHFAQRPDYRPLTKYETRGDNLGHKIFDLICLRDVISAN